MHHPTDRIVHTTAFVKPVVEHWLELSTRVKQSLVQPLYAALVYAPVQVDGVGFVVGR